MNRGFFQPEWRASSSNESEEAGDGDYSDSRVKSPHEAQWDHVPDFAPVKALATPPTPPWSLSTSPVSRLTTFLLSWDFLTFPHCYKQDRDEVYADLKWC